MKCKTCAAEITGHKRRFCGPTCYPSYKPRKETPRQDCQNCGKVLHNPPKAGRPRRNCTDQCRREIQTKRIVKKQKKQITCQHCHAGFLSANKQRFCSKPCRYKANKIESRVRFWEQRKAKYPDGFRTSECRWCKQPRTWEIDKSHVTAYHPECTIEARRARYRIKTVKRQNSLVRPSRLAADEVVRTYGQNCSVCGELIDLTLKRTSRMGLTIDHYIPLSKGGTDELSNLRPAHWICNNRKSNKLPKEVNA